MTTICADKQRMVSDSKIIMVKNGGDTQFSGPKLVRKQLVIIGVAGDSDDGDRFIKWYGSRKRKPKPTAEFEALVLTPKGLYHYDDALSCNRVNDPWFAIGSGSHAALGALHAGCDLERAVEIASYVDPNTGLPCQIMSLIDDAIQATI